MTAVIQYGNLSGPHFDECKVEKLASLAEKISEELDVPEFKIWYDAEFYHLSFIVNQIPVSIRYYKIYSVEVDGVERTLRFSFTSDLIRYLRMATTNVS